MTFKETYQDIFLTMENDLGSYLLLNLVFLEESLNAKRIPNNKKTQSDLP
jgi:hypothetical protein